LHSSSRQGREPLWVSHKKPEHSVARRNCIERNDRDQGKAKEDRSLTRPGEVAVANSCQSTAHYRAEVSEKQAEMYFVVTKTEHRPHWLAISSRSHCVASHPRPPRALARPSEPPGVADVVMGCSSFPVLNAIPVNCAAGLATCREKVSQRGRVTLQGGGRVAVGCRQAFPRGSRNRATAKRSCRDWPGSQFPLSPRLSTCLSFTPRRCGRASTCRTRFTGRRWPRWLAFRVLRSLGLHSPRARQPLRTEGDLARAKLFVDNDGRLSRTETKGL
jgi:hypothetical protein